MSEARAAWMDLPQEEHEFQFNPQRAFPNFKDAEEKRTAANAKARLSLVSHLDLPYGKHKLRRLDIFPTVSAERAAPVHVFVHGGYWRAQDKENYRGRDAHCWAPRTDPDRPDLGIRLLPRVFDVKAHVGPRVKDARLGKPDIDELRHTLPCEAVFLAAPPERSSPEVGHVVPER